MFMELFNVFEIIFLFGNCGRDVIIDVDSRDVGRVC